MNSDFLLTFGLLGDFGRFRAADPIVGRRGDRAVVRTPRGVELAEVLSPASAGHSQFLPAGTTGPLLRLATEEDERIAAKMHDHGDRVFKAARERAALLGLPLEVIDTEALLDGEHVVLHYVRWQDCDVRPLVSGLSKQFGLHVLLQDLTRAEEHDHAGRSCGSGGCGSGGCGSGGCGSGGCGTCGKGSATEVKEYFAGLREQMNTRNKVALL